MLFRAAIPDLPDLLLFSRTAKNWMTAGLSRDN
jgi:hypothetical protein